QLQDKLPHLQYRAQSENYLINHEGELHLSSLHCGYFLDAIRYSILIRGNRGRCGFCKIW
ncbi:hypothetical protein RRG08_055882, partial [Elysia crispata]